MGRLPELIGGKYRNLRYFSGGRPFGRLMQEGDYMARKTNKPADEQKKPFDPWTATETDVRDEFDRVLKEHGFNGAAENPTLDPGFKMSAVKKIREAETMAKNGEWSSGDKNKGIVLLSAIKEGIEAGLTLPSWLANEIGKVLQEIETGRARKAGGWNCDKALGSPYKRDSQPAKQAYNKRLSFYIWWLKRSNEIKPSFKHKRLTERDKFQEIADYINKSQVPEMLARQILGSNARVPRLTGANAEKIYGDYKDELEKIFTSSLSADNKVSEKV